MMLKPLADPTKFSGTYSVTAFIHIPLNPEIQKPKINTIGIKTPNAVPSGNKKRVSADNDDVIAIMLRTITLYPLNTISLRSEEHTSELQSRFDLVCRLLL